MSYLDECHANYCQYQLACFCSLNPRSVKTQRRWKNQPESCYIGDIEQAHFLRKVSEVVAHFVLPVAFLALLPLGAQAQQRWQITVVIERVQNKGSGDACAGSQDFYAIVNFPGDRQVAAYIDGHDDLVPGNWEFTFETELYEIPVAIDIWEDDNWFCGGDNDHIDVSAGAGQTLGFAVELAPSTCTLSGDLVGDCGVTMRSEGTDNDKAVIWVKTSAIPAPSGPGVRISCLHDPLWPQQSDQVKFTARIYDNLGYMRTADQVEVWVNTRTAAAMCSNQQNCTVTQGPFSEPTLSYACRAQIGQGANAFEVDSGWRTVQVGPPKPNEDIYVVLTGEMSNRIDILFMPDVDHYPQGATDPQFLIDVHRMIDSCYRRDRVFLENQTKLNFWLAQQPGNLVEAPQNPQELCVLALPLFSSDRSYDATVLVVHAPPLCQQHAEMARRVTSADSPNVFVHETLHVPFGLSDEYCKENYDGYFQHPRFPNVFASLAACLNDPRRPGIVNACAQITDPISECRVNWWRLDGEETDVMINNWEAVRRADRDAIEGLFTSCFDPGENVCQQ